jgi:hypothetical protein
MPNINAVIPYQATINPINGTNPVYTWTLPDGGGTISTNNGDDIIVTWGNTTGTFKVRVSVTGDCTSPAVIDEEIVVLTNGGCNDFAPTNLTANTSASNIVLLNWTENSVNETGFEIEYSIDNSNWLFFGTESANSTQNFSTPNAIQPNTLYYFRVRNLGTCNSDWSNTAQVLTAPSIPQNFVTNATGSIYELNLFWTDSNPNTGTYPIVFEVEAAHRIVPCESNFYRSIITTSNITHLINNLKARALTNPYSVRVRAVNINGVVSNWNELLGQQPTTIVGPFVDNDPVTCAYWTN